LLALHKHNAHRLEHAPHGFTKLWVTPNMALSNMRQ
jgi:hypothetical protein